MRSFGKHFLAKYLNESSSQPQLEQLSKEDLQAYFQVLIEILEAISESNGNTEVVYPLFAANTDKLDDIFAEILRRWVINKFEEIEADVAKSIAAFIFIFGSLIQQFPLGNKASNMEIAIASYETVLEFCIQEAFPQQWAMTQSNLGNAYTERIKGDKAENIEQAIQLYQTVLQVFTQHAFPQEWAMIQNNLGNAYWNRIKGDKAENIEQAIQFFQAALLVRSPNNFPQDWAGTQNNLGLAYTERINGDKAENIELAIQFYQAALLVYTQEDFPQDWATTQNNLATAYSDRIKGDKAENIEQAIQFCQAALLVTTQEDFPQDWARTQNNLATAYNDRIKGDKAENIEQAIQSYQAALLVYTQEAFPEKWATTQNNLATAYTNRIKGDKAENIEQAIQSYQAALLVYTQEAFPQNWAGTQYNLGLAYNFRIKGDKAENIEQAIQCYQAALLVRTQQALPQNWALTQYNFAAAYSSRIKGNKAENIELAIQFLQAALLVRTQQAFPEENAETLFGLGTLYQNEGRFTSAYNTYESAIATVELLRGEIISGEESKRKQAEKWNPFYSSMVEVCLQLQKETLALEYIERSKTRNLVELILERDSKTIFPPNIVTQLEQLRDEIATGQYKIQNGTAENSTALAQHLQELRERKKSLEDEYLPIGSGFNFEKFQATLDKNTAIIEWYITNTGFETFIITSDNLQRFNLSTPTDNLQTLIDWSLNYFTAYYKNKDEWIDNLAYCLTQLAEILNIEKILKLIPQNCSHLILIPHRVLHLFPLHALPLSDGSFICDKFKNGVSYAPSCQLLQQVNIRKRIDFNSLFAIQNPTEDLDYTDLEVETISSLFTEKEILSKKQATKTALSQSSSQLQQTNYLHFSCHGTFNLKTPQNSCLLLAGADENDELDLSKCLTLGSLFERDFNLNQCRLVVLAACETGLIDFGNDSDEYIGLPSGFLYAGSSSVVSSLWTVNDLSTSFLMIKFIQNLKNIENISVPVALNQAQNWLRNATKEDLQEWANNLPLNNPLYQIQLMVFFNQIQDNSKPFQSPFYWAAFTAVGH